LTFRWLIAKNRNEEAHKILVKYHAGGDEASPLVDFEMKEIEDSIRLEEQINSQTSYYDLIRSPANRRRTLISVIVGWWATWGGIGLISYYLTLVLDTIGITTVSQQTLINALLQIYNWFFALSAAVFIDRIGRRPLWLISAGGMTISYIAWTVLSERFAATKDAGIGKGVLAFIFLYNAFYDIGFCPMIFAYPIEIWPYTLRARGLTISIATTEAGLIMGMFVNPIALNAIGWKYYILFCCILALFFVLIFFLFPETKGHTLEEIAEVFDGNAADKLGPDDMKVDEQNAAEEGQIEVRHLEETIPIEK
jgi:MFS family permease